MSFTPLKPWLTAKAQLELLTKRGLIVHNEMRALRYLNTLGYYRLSGYFYPFFKFGDGTRQNDFVFGTTFDDVLNLYLFDKGLRLLAFDALEWIEMAIRLDISHTLGKRHPNAHEIPSHLNMKKHEAWHTKYQTLVHRSKNQDFIAHHLKKIWQFTHLGGV